MQMLLLGDHPDGVEAALALVRRGWGELVAYAGPPNTAERLRQAGVHAPRLSDAEAALAQRGLDWIIVADELAHRPQLLKRALQSGCDVAVVHPADLEPDVAYEALVLQQDSGKRLVPLLPERCTPSLQAVRELLAGGQLGELRQVELELHFTAPRTVSGQFQQDLWESHPLFTLWEPLRLIAGEILELSAVASGEEQRWATVPLVISGRFSAGPLLHVALFPETATTLPGRLRLRGAAGEAQLEMPGDWFGAATLRVGADETALPSAPPREELLADLIVAAAAGKPTVTWTDATRCLELCDATRRSVRRRRLVLMDYEAVSEVGNFKSTMTALGCGVLLVVMVLFFATPTFPFLKYFIPPILFLYLLLQVLRWVARDSDEPAATPPQPEPAGEHSAAHQNQQQ